MCFWIKRGSWFSTTNGNGFSLCRTQELAFERSEIHVVKRKREKTEIKMHLAFCLRPNMMFSQSALNLDADIIQTF